MFEDARRNERLRFLKSEESLLQKVVIYEKRKTFGFFCAKRKFILVEIVYIWQTIIISKR